jgi:uncharacterized membrane protein
MDRSNAARGRGRAWSDRFLAAALRHAPHDGRNCGVDRHQYCYARASGDLALARDRNPSPDMLYSICVYDLGATDGAVRISTHDMPETYWSVSVFDANTNNFYALNDRQAKTGAADFLLVGPGRSAETGRLPVVTAPTNRGIVLFRTLVHDESHIAEIDAARHYAACEPYRAAGG